MSIHSSANIETFDELFAVDKRFSYPWDVVDGRIPACLKIRQACQRHISDLYRDDVYFDVDLAIKAVRFVESNITFVGSTVEGKPYVLLPWAHWVYTSLLCWLRNEDRYRRFRRGLVNTAKGSGKSPLAALAGLRLCFSSNQKSAQGFVVASTAEQSSVLFNYAARFVWDSPKLSTFLRVKGGRDTPWLITARKENAHAFLRKFSGTSKGGKGKSGWTPNVILVDELHEIETTSNIDLLTAGVKGSTEPMTLITSNAGSGIGTPVHREYVYAEKVLDGTLEDDQYFAAIYETDADQDPYDEENGEACWIQANPSLPHTPGYEYIRARVKQSRGMPSVRSEVDRLNFSRWVEAGDPFLDPVVYDAIEVDELSPLEERINQPTFIALDLSKTRDLTAGAALWHFDDHWELEVTAWTPHETVIGRAERDGAPYQEWIDAGYLISTPGSVVDYRSVCLWIMEHYNRPGFQCMAYDQWNIKELERVLEEFGQSFTRDEDEDGIWYLPHGQGPTHNRPREDDPEEMIRLWMPRSLRHFERLAMKKQIRIKKNPVTRCGILGIITSVDIANNRTIDRRKAQVQIDPGVAAVMAVGLGIEFMSRRYTPFSLEDFII